MNALIFLLAALIGYLCGSIPFGYLYVRLFKGEDLTQIGSGRTGGTNSFRAAGLGVGVLTSVSDVLKGAFGLLIPTWLFGGALGPELLPWAQALAGVMTVVGHNWSIFLRFKGGAGTGPNVGWCAAIWWPIFPIAFLVMGGLLWLVGMASVASLAMAGVLIVVFGFRYFAGIDPSIAYLIGSLAAGAVITFALRPNIRRVLDGTERRVGPAARRAEAKRKTAP
jgi:glycerol-3-phosphate acyltransferase PlsY